MRDADVSDLRVGSPVHQASVQHAAATQAGTDRDVQEVLQTLRRAPVKFGESGGVDVRVECDPCAQRVANRTHKIEIPPGQFRSGGDIAERGRLGVGIDRPERADSYGVERLASPEERDCAADGFFRRRSRELDRLEIARIASDSANELGAAGFDSSQAWHWSQFKSLSAANCLQAISILLMVSSP